MLGYWGGRRGGGPPSRLRRGGGPPRPRRGAGEHRPLLSLDRGGTREGSAEGRRGEARAHDVVHVAPRRELYGVRLGMVPRNGEEAQARCPDPAPGRPY